MCELETDRLELRQLGTDRDLDFIADLLAHPEVMRFWPAPLSRDEAAAWIERQIERYERDGFGYWLVSLRRTGEPIGQAGLMTIEIDGAPEVGLGYIIHADHWGRGNATEAAAACLAYGCDTLGLGRIVAPVRPENAASIRVAEKIGMTLGRRTMFAGFEHIIYIWQAT